MTLANPPVHHTNGDARFHYTPSVAGFGWTSALNTGYAAWDKTNGHQFDYVRVFSAGSAAAVSVVTGTICGSAAAIGCTSTGLVGRNIAEGASTIRFKSSASSSLWTAVAAHEFGHYLGLGHSKSWFDVPTMQPTVQSGMHTLHAFDRNGRCQVYGHALGLWGGCSH